MALQLGRDVKELEQYCEDTTEIEKGIDFIISHLEDPLIFPRKISTQKSQNKQFSVRDKQEIINSFIDSKLIDCRINAFPILKEGATWIPDFVFIDLDLADFNFNKRSLKLALNKTLKNIKEKLNGDDDDTYNGKDVTVHPTVLWSGNGYHILLPVYCPIVLEHIQQFQGFTCTNNKPSEAFLRFAKDYLSNYKADKANSPSFRSCLLRIPNSLNSKCLTREDATLENSKVKIIQQWNGYRPPIKGLLYDFRRYLIQKKIEAYNYRQKTLSNAERRMSNKIGYNGIYYYEWIEKKILENPFEDCRKVIVDLILAPYLINIKKLSFEESYQITREWLDRCNSLNKLDNRRNFESRISYALKSAENKRIGPMGQEKIKIDNNFRRLYLLVNQKGKYNNVRD